MAARDSQQLRFDFETKASRPEPRPAALERRSGSPDETPKTSSEPVPETVPPEENRDPVGLDPDQIARLETPLGSLRYVSKKRRALLEKLQLRTVEDVLENYPRDYLDRTRFSAIIDAARHAGEEVTVQGQVVRHEDVPVRKPKAPKVVRTLIYDGTGVAALIGFGKRAGYLKVSLRPGDAVVVSGQFKPGRYGVHAETTSFEYEVLSGEEADLIHTGRLVPKYSLTAELTHRWMRTLHARVLDEFLDAVPEVLPRALRQRYRLWDRRRALRAVHFPESAEELHQARRRLVFEEFLLLQLGLLLRRRNLEAEEGIAFRTDGPLARKFLESLPFRLTHAQERVLREVEADMRRPRPMNRLIQGDVGSGKTVVAAAALVHAVENGYQGAIMAPTEILAEQHAQTLQRFLKPVGIEPVLLTGSLTPAQRRTIRDAIASGVAAVVVGTHALIQEDVSFANLGLVITDEQHRFGVKQRQQLRNKGRMPDTLVMTATPIPRTLALTVYGDLSLSVIDEMPPGRKPVITKHFTESERDRLYRFVDREIQKGRQVYVIYPLIEESEKLEDVRAAVEGYEKLSRQFPHWRVGLLHGQLSAEEKQTVMAQFQAGQLDVLVSTTVIEVGVDVPNATVMIVENADRFGLAQLHQLRGRVGRGAHQSYCALVGWPKTDEARRRLNVMTRTTDGFEIAEEDLAIRGPGDILGTRQAGLPDLKIANLLHDGRVLEVARQEAQQILDADPTLSLPEHQPLREMVRRKWQNRLNLATVG